ncbi:MAG: sulfatase-like hydrolase/transferase, partial [Candidatus Aenigmarchaeota archaeon]|nr:sulfatase-like hydrolase/transferase [Candidatus Aenigmarchaeota archaeon]
SNIHTKLIRDVQKPYNDFSKEFFSQCAANEKRYDSYMKGCEDYLKSVLDKIKALGMTKDTAIVVVSDHGVSFGEKEGERMYGSFTFDYTLKTFCIIKAPGLAPREAAWQASSVDVLPTILDVFNVKRDEKRENPDGSSLLTLKKDRMVFSETGGLGGPWPSQKAHNVFCARLPDAKAVYYKTPDKWEFYNLKNDPKERNPRNQPSNEPEKSLMQSVKERYRV